MTKGDADMAARTHIPALKRRPARPQVIDTRAWDANHLLLLYEDHSVETWKRDFGSGEFYLDALVSEELSGFHSMKR
jgi:hypothetical protein